MHTYPPIHTCACITMPVHTRRPHHAHTLTPVHTHTHAPWILHAHMHTIFHTQTHAISLSPTTRILHTHTHKVHACTHVHSHPRSGATSGTRADTVHTVHTPHTCAQDLMPAHTQAALLGSLVFWQSENTSGHQMVTALTTSLQRPADNAPSVGTALQTWGCECHQCSGTWF